MENKIRPIAIYLPQFHPFPENDEWWGKGFTEWTNVTKAKPQFKGHYQPHLPTDLGFYDLRLEETRMEQAKLAKEYGIYGFCYYHYWFDGKRLMSQPMDDLLKSKKPDFPFMLCWANENWSRKWDGSEHLILIKQNYCQSDAEDHCRFLIPFFKDERYIKVDNKPFFCFYKPLFIPDFNAYVEAFRAEALRHGVELYIGYFQTPEVIPDGDFDAAVEFQPQSKNMYAFMEESVKKNRLSKFNKQFFLKILDRLGLVQHYYDAERKIRHNLDYSGFVDYSIQHNEYPENYVRYPGVTPMWDNTARRGKDAFMFRDPSPEKFEEWLQFHKANFKPHTEEENFLFITAWNEWAEGSHLEPCTKWGRAYLEVVKKVFGSE